MAQSPNPRSPTDRPDTWLGSVARLRCPRCRVGALFPTGTFSFSKPLDMHRRCPRCGEDYWPEPGFYYGAMFLSYIVFSFPCLGFVALLHWGFGLSLGASMTWLIVLAGLGFVYVFRVSRSLWIHMNVKYDEAVSDRVLRGEPVVEGGR